MYTQMKKNNYLYAFQKILNNGLFYDLRCKDRSCKGRVKYDINKREIIIIQSYILAEYENHNYVKEKLIKKRINRNEIDERICMNIYIKKYFQETYAQYPTMTYNQILLNMIEKYKVKKNL